MTGCIARQPHIRLRRCLAGPKKEGADDDHERAEGREQALAIDRFASLRAERGARDTRCRKDERARPLDVADARVVCDAGSCIERDGDGGRRNGNMR